MRMLLISGLLGTALFAAEKLKPEEVVAAHLQSLGTPEARAAAKTRVTQGTVRMEMLHPGQGWVEGPAFIASDERKFRIALLFRNDEYWAEDFAFDGSKADVGWRIMGQRTNLGRFFLANGDLLKEGLFGGVLTTLWPLLNIESHGPKLEYDGIRKSGGREFHQLTYGLKKGGTATIQLFFEPETFRHVRTVYTWKVRNARQGVRAAQQGQQEVTYTLAESFDDFKNADGLAIPAKWTFRFSAEGGSQTDFAQEATVTLQQIGHNQPVDPRSYLIAAPTK